MNENIQLINHLFCLIHSCVKQIEDEYKYRIIKSYFIVKHILHVHVLFGLLNVAQS